MGRRTSNGSRRSVEHRRQGGGQARGHQAVRVNQISRHAQTVQAQDRPVVPEVGGEGRQSPHDGQDDEGGAWSRWLPTISEGLRGVRPQRWQRGMRRKRSEALARHCISSSWQHAGRRRESPADRATTACQRGQRNSTIPLATVDAREGPARSGSPNSRGPDHGASGSTPPTRHFFGAKGRSPETGSTAIGGQGERRERRSA